MANKVTGISAIRRAGMNPNAVTLASKISKQTFADLETTVDAILHGKVSGIIVAHDISSDFTKEEIDSMPFVDTVPADANGLPTRDGYIPAGTGDNARAPDWTTVQEGKRTKWISFFNTMVGATPYMKDLDKQIEAYTDAENKKEGHDKKLAAMGKGNRKAAIQLLRQKKSTIQNTYRKGVAVVQQKAKLTEVFGKMVNFSYYENAKGEIIPAPSPIILQMAGKADCFDTFSVSSFLSLDFEQAMVNREAETPQATWDAILATLSREDGDEDETDPNNIVISNRDQFFSGAAAMLHWMNDETNMRGVYHQIDKAKSLDDVSHLIKTLCGLATEYGDVFNHLQKKFEKLSIAESVKNGTADQKSIQQALTN